jgi:predicted methyltransferase
MEELPKPKVSESRLRAMRKYRQKTEVKTRERQLALQYYHSHREEQISKKLKIREDNKEIFLLREAEYRLRARARTEFLKLLPFFKMQF